MLRLFSFVFVMGVNIEVSYTDSNGIHYGYCSCGREVKKSDSYTDKKCPLCNSPLVWEKKMKGLKNDKN